ncbi:hypothetical protein [Candidatus Ichthyocystis sparus]|uniref:hypothetical protein n=1 Tax=Candidatus Ichthyocystis sparus TaxID=1561004 RepID=UPI000B89EF87|nr:hypothetical protein [Candidatus Ichthyocystis sparus]
MTSWIECNFSENGITAITVGGPGIMETTNMGAHYNDSLLSCNMFFWVLYMYLLPKQHFLYEDS